MKKPKMPKAGASLATLENFEKKAIEFNKQRTKREKIKKLLQ